MKAYSLVIWGSGASLPAVGTNSFVATAAAMSPYLEYDVLRNGATTGQHAMDFATTYRPGFRQTLPSKWPLLWSIVSSIQAWNGGLRGASQFKRTDSSAIVYELT